MRKSVFLIGLMLVLTWPAAAQFRDAMPPARSSSRIYGAADAAGLVLGKFFNPSVFRMSHGFEMSAGSFGGRGYSMGMYTNTMQWQFNSKLAARMDVSVAYSPQHQAATTFGFSQDRPQVFLRNAEVAWRPSDKFQFNIQVRQDPYARYHNPYYGHPYGYGPYARRAYMNAAFGRSERDLFWREPAW